MRKISLVKKLSTRLYGYELSLSVYDYVAIRTRVFELEANDKAYTLSFPKEVLDFQNNLSKNERPDRIPVETINH